MIETVRIMKKRNRKETMTGYRTALITGASGGLGLEFARLCAADGFDLVLAARSEGKLHQIRTELEQKYGITAYVCPVDLAKKDAALDVSRYTQEKDLTIDILINNAGFGDLGSFADADWQRQYDMVQVNITALMQLTHCFLKGMLKRNRGKILNVASVAAFCAGPRMSVYYASKAFVQSFSEALHEETAGSGVSVTALCPGPTATGFEKAASKNGLAMFKYAADPAGIALAGYQAMKDGKALCYPGASVRLMNFGTRITPRLVSRKAAGFLDR